MRPAKPRLPRNSGIDLVRGLSVIFVVIHHLGIRIPLKATLLADFLSPRILATLGENGYESVFVFFVISGFLITGHSLVRWKKLSAIDWRAFYARRASRILPCLLILVSLLSVLHLAGVPHYVINGQGQTLPGAVFSALALHLNWYEGQTGYLPASWDVLWSLSIEEVFYLGFPVICLLLRKPYALLSFLLLLALSLPITRAALVGYAIWKEKAYLPGMAAIATGMLAAILAERVKPNLKPALSQIFLWTGAAGMILAFAFEDLLWPALGNGCMLILTGSASLLLLSFHWRQSQQERRSLRAFAWIQSFGRCSYEIYLTHIFVVWWVVNAFTAAGANMAWGFVWFPPALLLSWGLGRLVAKYISSPAERFFGRGSQASRG